jgi:hypothetical protein
MKLAKITLSVALLGALTLGMADETTTSNTNNSIDTQITKIQNAPAGQRVELMNEFKQQLSTMNKEDRMAAISQMQEKMQTHAQENMQEGKNFGSATRDAAKGERDNMQEMGDMTHQRAQDMAQSKQAEMTDHMNQMQNMNQAQAGNQMQHMMDMQDQGGNGGQGGRGMSDGQNH